MAIDSNVKTALPILYATVDRCLFFDDDAGKPRDTIVQNGKNVRKFVNRGAINITSEVHDGGGIRSSSSPTVFSSTSGGAFLGVAEGNKAIVYNNLMFGWGVGNNEDQSDNGTNEWTGAVTDSTAAAVIAENRFIPWRLKTAATDAINIGRARKSTSASRAWQVPGLMALPSLLAQI